MLLQYILIALRVTECHEASRNMSPNIREQWKKDMEKAIIAMREKKLGTLKVAKFFKVPHTTLRTLAKEVALSQTKSSN
jgi:DNA integrity scanning protein DisA with diadenylate cyclase activity